MYVSQLLWAPSSGCVSTRRNIEEPHLMDRRQNLRSELILIFVHKSTGIFNSEEIRVISMGSSPGELSEELVT